jgi:hypothetical protein
MEDSSLTKCRALIKKNDVLSSITCGIESHFLMFSHHFLTKPERSELREKDSSF